MATAFVVVAVLSGLLVPVAAVVAAIAAILVHSLQSAEVAEVRLHWGHDRAAFAKAARRDAVAHSRWARQCEEQVIALLGEVRTAEQRRLQVTADLVAALSELEETRHALAAAVELADRPGAIAS